MKANVEYAMRHEAIGAEFRSYLDGLVEISKAGTELNSVPCCTLAPRDGLEPPT